MIAPDLIPEVCDKKTRSAKKQVLPGSELRNGAPVVLQPVAGSSLGCRIAGSDVGIPFVRVVDAEVVLGVRRALTGRLLPARTTDGLRTRSARRWAWLKNPNRR
jgi:hypothetical protein